MSNCPSDGSEALIDLHKFFSAVPPSMWGVFAIIPIPTAAGEEFYNKHITTFAHTHKDWSDLSPEEKMSFAACAAIVAGMFEACTIIPNTVGSAARVRIKADDALAISDFMDAMRQGKEE